MASLRVLGLDQNPSEQPLIYPGTTAQQSVLMVDDWLYALTVEPRKDLSQWEVRDDGGPLLLGGSSSLEEAILRVGDVAPMASRVPVVAVGSNAAPGQLLHKYRTDQTGPQKSIVIPITRVSVTNLAVAHSAHVSKPGYVPMVPVSVIAKRPVSLHALWLDSGQVEQMDETEPNYARVVVPTSTAIATLESGIDLPEFHLYRGRRGVLRSGPGMPPVMAASQSRVFGRLAALDWFRDLVPEIADGAEGAAYALAGDAGRREHVRHELAAHDLVAFDGLAAPMEEWPEQ